MSLISTPLNFNKVEPNNWEDWWKLWNREATTLSKVVPNHNAGTASWRGLDIYVKDGVRSELLTQYACKNVNCADLFSSIFDNIHLLPLDVQVVRAISSESTIWPHHDGLMNSHSIRTMLYDENTDPTWYYIDKNNKKSYQQLPDSSNTWMFMDRRAKHGTDFHMNRQKILICYYGKYHLHLHKLAAIEEEGKRLYPEYMIYES